MITFGFVGPSLPLCRLLTQAVLTCYSFFVAEITDEHKWNLLRKKTQEVQALRVFSAFRENDIEPILIKGLAAAQYYPEPGSRFSIDVDLAVPVTDFETACSIAVSPATKGIGIDVHREMRHLDTVGWQDLFINSRLIEVEGGNVRVLRPEDHLRVLCVHWLNDGGANKDKLWDIYYAVKNRPADFDWDRCLNIVSKTRRRWIVCAIGLARHYLQLNLDDTPIKGEADDLPAWLIREVEREWSSSTVLRPMHIYLNDASAFFAQIKKRLRPNAIQATVEMEGSFDARTRAHYQIGNIFKRIIPSYKRMSEAFKSKPA